MPISLLNSKESSKDKKTSGEMKLNCAYESRGINATLTWYWKAKKQKEKDTVVRLMIPILDFEFLYQGRVLEVLTRVGRLFRLTISALLFT